MPGLWCHLCSRVTEALTLMIELLLGDVWLNSCFCPNQQVPVHSRQKSTGHTARKARQWWMGLSSAKATNAVYPCDVSISPPIQWDRHMIHWHMNSSSLEKHLYFTTKVLFRRRVPPFVIQSDVPKQVTALRAAAISDNAWLCEPIDNYM